MLALDRITLCLRRDSTAIFSHAPRECPRCHRMTYFFINHHGRTTCTACATTHGGAE